MQRRGIELDREHQEAMEYSEDQQQVKSRRFCELERENDKEGLLQLSYDQVVFDHQMRNKIEQHYERERALRIEATQEIRARRVRIKQIAEEALRGAIRNPLPVEPTGREEIRQTLNEAKRGTTD